ncbi:chemotaxis protein CheA [Clostridium homopropionicum DSM 5847]|uniref:histidine kinase n=1 Tax=Clostridium homopropionicum DSM 5847 TaxID=1121318 RepID=A0A0L6ZC36_9CLOT|nr:7TM diverse intracellular signaling domain-containing protein [Clostridium homopropionicum]KOA20353.1 chemotaxis protein CheA [Clostridium homopropionicum DSM 5847]SFG73893.1 Chemotaxis protein histidine kinase CheA [Clostridium homopropionicum]
MNKKTFIIAISLLLVILTLWLKLSFTNKTSTITAKNGYLDLSQYDLLENNIIKLDGEWELYYNKLYTPEDFQSNSINSIQYFKIPSNLKGTIINGTKLSHYGFMTLRLKVKLNSNDVNRFLGIKTQDMLTASKIWVNGDLTDYHGVVGKNEEEYRPIFKPTVSIFQPKSQYIDIVIQAANFREPASMIKSIYLGTKNEVLVEENVQLGIDLFLFGSILIMSLYHLALFSIRRKDKSTLYFGLFSLVIAVRSLFMGERIVVQVFPNMPFEVLSKTAAISYYLALPLFLMFFKELFNEISDKVIYISKYVAIIMTLLCLVTTNKIYDKLAIPSQIYSLLICLYILYKLIKFLMEKRENSFEMFLGALIVMIAFLCDILDYDGYLSIRFAMPVGVFLFIFIQSYILAKYFTRALTLSESLANENAKMYSEIKEMNVELEDKVKERTMKLSNSRKALKNLLDNAGQGFLTFGKDYRVGAVFSIQCVDIFNGDIQDRRIQDLLFKNNPEDKVIFESITEEIFNTDDSYKIKILMELLPEEIEINNRNLFVEYKIITDAEAYDDKIIMIILTDISEKRQLENKIEREKEVLEMVVNSIIYYEDLRELINSYNRFCNSYLDNILNSNLNAETISYEILTKTHTFRGNFAQINMLKTANKLCIIEDNLSDLMRIHDELSKDDIRSVVNKDKIENAIKEDLETITAILGKDYFNDEKVIVLKTKLTEIEQAMKENFGEEAEEIVSMIKRLTYIPLKRLLFPYGKYIERIGANLQKQIYPFEIHGEDINVDPNKYHDLIRAMVHIFRNMVDHGIESAQDRIERGKDEYGKISCSLKKEGKHIKIEIHDDGCGIDLEVLKKKIVEKGLLSLTELEKLSDKEILDYIFVKGFTTRDKCTELSGKGLGLYHLKKQVKKYGGIIEVQTKADKGTTFIIIIEG